MQTLWYFHTFI